jgi:hypothetical protein
VFGAGVAGGVVSAGVVVEAVGGFGLGVGGGDDGRGVVPDDVGGGVDPDDDGGVEGGAAGEVTVMPAWLAETSGAPPISLISRA